jgi:hypothetical protein
MQVFALVCFSGLLLVSEWRLIPAYHIHFSKEERKNRKKEKRKLYNRRVSCGVRVFAIFFDTLGIQGCTSKNIAKPIGLDLDNTYLSNPPNFAFSFLFFKMLVSIGSRWFKFAKKK